MPDICGCKIDRYLSLLLDCKFSVVNPSAPYTPATPKIPTHGLSLMYSMSISSCIVLVLYLEVNTSGLSCCEL